jgi:hypothetical protein
MRTFAREIVRYCFRFLLFYWICFTFPFPLELVSMPLRFVERDRQPQWMIAAAQRYGEVYSWIARQKDQACTRLSDRVLHVEMIIQPTGSGDTMRAYVGCLCAVVISAVAALLWTAVVLLVQRRTQNCHLDDYLYTFARVLVRFFLCEMLFGYGFAKVFPLQFSQPSSFRLTQQLGDMSPMGLLWTFMGYSPIYQSLSGAVEVLAGLLLTTRRTTPLGAFTTIVAMTHIFLLNMCFDVPVKLYSFHYLMMAIFLAAPDIPRLFSVLVLGRAVEARLFTRLFGNVKLDRLALVLRTLLVIAMLYGHVQGSYQQWNDMYGGPPAPVTGRWDLVSMTIDKKEPGDDDPLKWAWLDFSNRKFIRLSGPKPPPMVYMITWHMNEKKLTLAKFREPMWSATLSFDLPEPDKLNLEGTVDGKIVSASLKRAPEKHFELTTRGFQWIQELPYNR